MEVYKLTSAQRNQLVGQTYDGITPFNTDAIDADGNYYIGVEEFNMLTLVRANEIGVIEWWFTLPLIPYNPVVIDLRN
jgi:hypothetical protein